MKKLFMLVLAGLLVSMSAAAFADVDVTTTVDKDKNKTVTEDITITKNVLLNAKQLAVIETSAQAEVTKNDLNADNLVIEVPAEIEPLTLAGEEVQASAFLGDFAFQFATGVISVNQAPGSANNQGNAVALAYAAESDEDPETLLHAESSVDKVVGEIETPSNGALRDISGIGEAIAALLLGLTVDLPDGLLCSNFVFEWGSTHTDEITDNAFQDATGIVSVNQASGNCNNQDNGVSAAVGTEEIVYALAEADLGLINAGNCIVEVDVLHTDTINTNAFQNATGLLSVNQVSGNCNNQANSLAVCVVAPGLF